MNYKMHLSKDERDYIDHYLKEGYSCSEISRLINRGRNTIIAEVRRNGGRDNYDSVKAEERALCVRLERIRKLSKTQTNIKNNFTNIVQRVENLEMQIEILLNVIKELKRNVNNGDSD